MTNSLSTTADRLYILDFGLFEVNEAIRPHDRTIGIPGYLIQAEGKNILVDTGFPAKYAADPDQATAEDGLNVFGRVLRLTEENLPAGQLAKIGLRPSDIDRLVMTHSDIDHVGGIADFPEADIVIGRAQRALARPQYFGGRSPIAWPTTAYHLIKEDTDLCAGVRLLQSAGHAPGHLSLLVHLPLSGHILLTADAISRPAEFHEGFGGAWDEALARESAERLMHIAAETGATIIYGHDPAQWSRLKKAPAFYG